MSSSSYLEKRLNDLRGTPQTVQYPSNTIRGTGNVETKTYIVGGSN